jgi:DNA-directed RNA polymerase, alpha subunit/40 kD subunit
MTRTCPTCGHELVIPQGPIPDYTRIGSLDLPSRLRNALFGHNVLTVGNLRALSDAEILRIPEVGRVSLERLRPIRWGDNRASAHDEP